MSGTVRLPSEIDELFKYSDNDGLLDPEDLERAGFNQQQAMDTLEIWENSDTLVSYRPDTRCIENYRVCNQE